MEISETIIIEELKSLKESSEKLIGSNERFLASRDHGAKMNHIALCRQVDEIIEEYNWIIPKINDLMIKIGINITINSIKIIDKKWEDLIKENPIYSTVDQELRQISLKCGRVLSVLNNVATKTLENKNKFEGIKEEIEGLKKEMPENVSENLKEALKEFESNHLLSATLICGRVIIYHLDSVSNQIEEIINKLKEKNILQIKGSDEQILKANKKARGLFAHDLNYFPTPSEALSIFGDTINIVKKVNDYLKKESH